MTCFKSVLYCPLGLFHAKMVWEQSQSCKMSEKMAQGCLDFIVILDFIVKTLLPETTIKSRTDCTAYAVERTFGFRPSRHSIVQLS